MRQMSSIALTLAAPPVLLLHLACGSPPPARDQGSAPAAAAPASGPHDPAQTAAAPAPGPAASVPEAPAARPAAPAPKPYPAATAPPARAPEPPPAPRTITVVVPAGTTVHAELETPLSSATTTTGEAFRARVTQPIVVEGKEAVPAGSILHGVVDEAVSAKHWDKGGKLALRFERLVFPSGEEAVVTAAFGAEGKSGSGKKKAAIIAGSAVGGAILGKVIGKDSKDAAIGAAIGGGAGTAVVAGQKGEEVELPAATSIEIALGDSFQVKVPY